jgi:multiple sugar transport system substrate-binding protein
VLGAWLLTACGREYVNPDNGGQSAIAERCTAAAAGAYRLEVSVLPNDASQQREQLVRRLAARDASIDLLSVDPPFVAELATAGFLSAFTAEEERELVADGLAAAVASARWNGQLMAAPLAANTQLLWYRRSVARRAGLDPAARPVTWDELIGAAKATGTTVEVQARRYEGYMVWISALVASAGGTILDRREAGRDAVLAIDGDAGRAAARIIRTLADSPAANPGLSTADEEVARAAFQGARGGFMVNWPYVHAAAVDAASSGSLAEGVLDDIAWARYPRVDHARPSRPPLGGIHIAVSAFGQHRDLAAHAVRCITSFESQRQYMLVARLPAARGSVYDDPEVRRAFPMADAVRESIDEAAPRPQTPYYTDVSAAVVREFHSPWAVDPEQTPAAAAELVADVLHDRVLL